MPVALFILLFVGVLIISPLALIWALNTLFPVLAIPVTFWTWLATFILAGPFISSFKVKQS